MEYALSGFWLLAAGFAAGAGIVLLRRRRGPVGLCMGAFALILAACALFWQLPRSLALLLQEELLLWQGLGRLAAGLGLTACLLLLYAIWEMRFRPGQRDALVFWLLWGFAALRLALCLMPQNRWTENGFSPLWATLRTAALAGAAAPAAASYRVTRAEDRALRPVWLLQTLSVLFFFPGALGIGPEPGLFFVGTALCQAGTLRCFLKDTK